MNRFLPDEVIPEEIIESGFFEEHLALICGIVAAVVAVTVVLIVLLARRKRRNSK